MCVTDRGQSLWQLLEDTARNLRVSAGLIIYTDVRGEGGEATAMWGSATTDRAALSDKCQSRDVGVGMGVS